LSLEISGIFIPARHASSTECGRHLSRAVSRHAHSASAVVSIAGNVTAGKSRASAPVPQMPTATSQKWNSAWPASQNAAADQSGRRAAGRATPASIAIATNRKISPMSRTKCWLNGPVVVTPGTAKYHRAGEQHEKTVDGGSDAERRGQRERQAPAHAPTPRIEPRADGPALAEG
jgi:hypothetical protein